MTQSTPTHALDRLPIQHAAVPVIDRITYSADQRLLIRTTYARGTTDEEFSLFMAVSERLGLDPLSRQIYAVKRWDAQLQREAMAIQVGIDGYRLIAARTGHEDGQDGPFFCGADGVWQDSWLRRDPPRAAKVLIYKRGIARAYVGLAHYDEFVQRKKDGTPTHMWETKPCVMLAKCAEATALRKAHPAELGGTYVEDELGEHAIDAKFTEVRAPAAQPIAGTGRPPTMPAAVSAVVDRPILLPADVERFRAALQAAPDLPALDAIVKDIARHALTEDQRQLLGTAQRAARRALEDRADVKTEAEPAEKGKAP